MRNRIIVTTAALLLASATFAVAQQQQTPPATKAPAAIAPTFGTIDFGFRGLDTSGDAARFQRYSDLRNGAHSRFEFGKKTDTSLVNFTAANVGYRDQRYDFGFTNGRATASATWDSTPLNYAYNAATPWVDASTGTSAIFTLDSAARLAVQSKQAGIVGIPTTAVAAGNASIYRGLARGFELKQRRDTAAAGFALNATRDVTVNFAFSTAKKSGAMPWGASFAFNNANELPLPLDNRTDDFNAGVEWTNPKGMVRLGWTGSWFNNDITELIWDNPLRATDATPYDPSGYSNGNGPARGRMSMPPTNHMTVVSATALYKLPRRTTVNGALSMASMKQDEALIPWTINPAIANAGVYAGFPGLAHLERSTAEAEVRGINALLNLTARPTSKFGLNVKYRFNDHDNRTPIFDAVEYVRFDAVPEETGGETEPFDFKRSTFDVNGTFHLTTATALRVGYTFDTVDRLERAAEQLTDNTFRASVDTMQNQYVTVRAIYEHTVRDVGNLDVAKITGGGGQPALRFYDEAARDRDKATLLFVVNPMPEVDLTASVAAAKDKYNKSDQYFGLLDNTNNSFNFGINVTPGEQVAFGANYGRDKFSSLQRSRNANPAPDVSWTDPNRDWTLDNDETVNNFDVYLDLRRAIKKTDVSFTYNLSDSDNAFVHGGPRIAALTALGTFQALPTVTNKWQQFRADLKYFFDTHVGIGLGYWYEKFDVSDYATIDLPGQAGTPRIDYLGEISTGYANRPYTGNTGFVRLLYTF